MTRKRFVKLLMADGYSRNDANSIARETIAEGCSYGKKHLDLWTQRMFPFPDATLYLDRMKKIIDIGIEAITEALPSVIQAVCEMIPVFADIVQKNKIACAQSIPGTLTEELR